MKVLLLHPHDIRYFPWTIRIIKFAEILGKKGHDVTLVHPSVSTADLEYIPRKIIFSVPDDAPYRVVCLGDRQRCFVRNVRTITDLARDVDLIHIQKCYPSVVIPALAASWRWDLPIHYDWDDHETAIVRRVQGIPRGFARMTGFFERRLPRFATTISAASRAIRDMAIERGFSADRIVDAPVGADLKALSPENDGSSVRQAPEFPIGDAPLALYLGQLEGAAYAQLFLEAAEEIRKTHPKAKFLVVGGGEMLPRLREQAERKGLAGTLHLTGYVNRTEVPDYLAAADVAVACFEDDEITRCKSPLKIAEYLAAGKAVVAGNVGEVPRMLGAAGTLAEPGDPRSLAEGIIRYFDRPELRTEHGRLARKRAEEVYNWERTTESIERAYRMAVRG